MITVAVCLLLVQTTQHNLKGTRVQLGADRSIYKTHLHKFIMDSLKVKSSNPK